MHLQVLFNHVMQACFEVDKRQQFEINSLPSRDDAFDSSEFSFKKKTSLQIFPLVHTDYLFVDDEKTFCKNILPSLQREDEWGYPRGSIRARHDKVFIFLNEQLLVGAFACSSHYVSRHNALFVKCSRFPVAFMYLQWPRV